MWTWRIMRCVGSSSQVVVSTRPILQTVLLMLTFINICNWSQWKIETFGANHLFQGVNYINSLSIGWYVFGVNSFQLGGIDLVSTKCQLDGMDLVSTTYQLDGMDLVSRRCQSGGIDLVSTRFIMWVALSSSSKFLVMAIMYGNWSVILE